MTLAKIYSPWKYDEARKKKDYGYERDLEQTLAKLIDECDRRISKGLKRIEENEANNQGSDISEALNKEIMEVSSNLRIEPKSQLLIPLLSNSA